MTSEYIRGNWPTEEKVSSARMAMLEDRMKVGRRRGGDEEGVERLVMEAGRRKGFYQGPFSPSSRRSPGRRTPTRLGSRHATRKGYGDSISETSSRRTVTPRRDEEPDFSTTDPIQAIRRIVNLTEVKAAKDFVSQLLCVFADDLGTLDTIMECRKFLHFERTRQNRVVPPPEGWESVRDALVDFHGTIRAAFTNMCAGRRGGVMSAAELHRGMITVNMPHVTEKFLNAICPEQIIPPDEIFIDFEEFMWIMNGCGDQGVPPDPNRPMRDASSTAEIRERVDVVVGVGIEPERVKDLEEQVKTVASLEARLAQLEAAATESPKTRQQSSPPATPTRNKVPPPQDSVKSPSSPASPTDFNRKTTPQLVPIWGDTDLFASLNEDGNPDPPKSPSYQKSPSMRPRSPTTARRTNSVVSMSGSARYTSPPKSIPPGVTPECADASYPAKVPTGPRSYNGGGFSTNRPPSPVGSKRPVSPTVVAPNPSFIRPPSPTASVRSGGWGSPHSARAGSFSGSMASDAGSVRRIASSIKSPIKPRGSSTRRPGMVSPPQSRPPGAQQPSAFDTESHHSSTYPYQRTQSFEASSPVGGGNRFQHQPGSPTSFKRPPSARRGSVGSASVVSNSMPSMMSKGARPEPPQPGSRSSSEDGALDMNASVQEPSPHRDTYGGSPANSNYTQSPTDRSLSPGSTASGPPTMNSVKAAPKKPTKPLVLEGE